MIRFVIDGLIMSEGNHVGLDAILNKPYHHSPGMDGDDNISMDPDQNDRVNIYQSFVQSAALSSITSGDGSHHGKTYKMSVAALQMTPMLSPDRNRRARMARHLLTNQLFRNYLGNEISHRPPRGRGVETKVAKERNDNNNDTTNNTTINSNNNNNNNNNSSNSNNDPQVPTESTTMAKGSGVVIGTTKTKSTDHVTDNDNAIDIEESSLSQEDRHLSIDDDDDEDEDTSLEVELMLARIHAKKDNGGAHNNGTHILLN